MATQKQRTITLNKGGSAEKTVNLDKVKIPDLWNIATSQENQLSKAAILETWHLAHDLLRALKEARL